MMKSPLLKRRLNPFLLATTVLVLSILAALSVLYQGHLSDLLSDKQELNETLENKSQQISMLEAENTNLSQELQNQQEDIQTYLNENEALKARISNLNNTVNTLEAEIQNLNSDINQLENEKSGLEADLAIINGTLEDICTNENNTIQDEDEHCNEFGHDYDGN